MNNSFFDFKSYQIPETTNPHSEGAENPDLVFVIGQEDYDNHKELALKIAEAIGFSLENNLCCYLIENDVDINISSLLPKACPTVISFGIKPSRLSLNASFKAYHFYQTETFKILFSHSLSKLTEDQKFKKALWTTIQILKNGK